MPWQSCNSSSIPILTNIEYCTQSHTSAASLSLGSRFARRRAQAAGTDAQMRIACLRARQPTLYSSSFGNCVETHMDMDMVRAWTGPDMVTRYACKFLYSVLIRATSSS
jgi:hypothetical protein